MSWAGMGMGMAKRTKVALSKWLQRSKGWIWGMPLGLPLPHDWVSPSIDDTLDPAKNDWEGIGSIGKHISLDSVGPVDDGGRVMCKLGGMTFTTAAAAIEDF
jgi:hypothetical protein